MRELGNVLHGEVAQPLPGGCSQATYPPSSAKKRAVHVAGEPAEHHGPEQSVWVGDEGSDVKVASSWGSLDRFPTRTQS